MIKPNPYTNESLDPLDLKAKDARFDPKILKNGKKISKFVQSIFFHILTM